jgi:hypothetical protein
MLPSPRHGELRKFVKAAFSAFSAKTSLMPARRRAQLIVLIQRLSVAIEGPLSDSHGASALQIICAVPSAPQAVDWR